MSDTEPVQAHDRESADGFEQLARAAGQALRAPAPDDVLRRIVRRGEQHQQQRRIATGGVVAGLIVAVLFGVLWRTSPHHTEPAHQYRLGPFEGHESLVGPLSLFANGRMLITTASSDGNASAVVRVFDTADHSTVTKFTVPQGVESVAGTADGSMVAVVHFDGSAELRNADTGRLIRAIAHAENFQFSPDDTTYATDSGVFDVGSGRQLVEFSPAAVALTFADHGSRVVTLDADQMMVRRDVGSGKQLLSRRVNGTGSSFSNDGRTMLAFTPGLTINGPARWSLWNTETGVELGSGTSLGVGQNTPVAPDGSSFVILPRFGAASLISGSTGERRWAAYQGTVQPYAAAYSPDGRYVAIRTDKAVSVWSVATGRLVTENADDRTARSSFFDSVEFAPDSRHLVSTNGGDPVLIDVTDP